MRGSSVWVLASWNVWTLLDIDGSIETARKGVVDAEVVDERKIDQVVGELNRYKVDVAALQETKWFWSGLYEVGECVVLAAGRPVPGDGVVKQRGEGVAVVLSGVAVSAWKDAGKSWKAWSSRLISVKLKVARGNRDKYLYMWKKPPSKQEVKKGRRFDVAQLGRESGGTRNKDTVREKYVAEVRRRLKDGSGGTGYRLQVCVWWEGGGGGGGRDMSTKPHNCRLVVLNLGSYTHLIENLSTKISL